MLALMEIALVDLVPEELVYSHAQKLCEADLKSDEGLSWFTFQKTIFEITDHWTTSCEVSEYFKKTLN